MMLTPTHLHQVLLTTCIQETLNTTSYFQLFIPKKNNNMHENREQGDEDEMSMTIQGNIFTTAGQSSSWSGTQ